MGAFVSETYTQLLAANRRHWTTHVYVNQYFENGRDIVLEEDEFKALTVVMDRVGLHPDPNNRRFSKPNIPTID